MSTEQKEQKPFVPKTPMDFQKLKLERLMANPNKPVVIPDTPKEKKGFAVPEFVRNVMGSSAGAGSGEFHVYRHLRRKEYTRQKVIEEKAEKEKLDDEFRSKLEENKRKMEERTEKKRAKRLKRKLKQKLKGSPQKHSSTQEQVESNSGESEVEHVSDYNSENNESESGCNENSKEGSSSENVKSCVHSTECLTTSESVS